MGRWSGRTAAGFRQLGRIDMTPESPRPSRVYFFGTCLIDSFYPEAGLAAIRLIEREGVRVIFPRGQSCCGQPAFNSGYWDEARQLAQRYRDIFAGYDAVVSPSGSCTAMVRNFYPELGVESPATYEFAEFLVKKLGVTDVGAKFPAKVTYHDACHALRELRAPASSNFSTNWPASKCGRR